MNRTNDQACTCQARIKAAINTKPSAGHDYVDEIIGLLRVTRGQRDDEERRRILAENRLEADTARLDWLDNWGYELEVPKSWSVELPSDQTSNTRNIRAAIDAALKTHEEKTTVAEPSNIRS